MFKPQAIFYEKEIINYPLGRQLMEQYKDVPKSEIENQMKTQKKEHNFTRLLFIILLIVVIIVAVFVGLLLGGVMK